MRYARAATALDYRMPVPLLLVAPGLLEQPAHALAEARSMAALAALAPPPRVEVNGIFAALVTALGGSSGTPIAPLMAEGAGLDAAGSYVIAADPVLLAADRGDIVLVQRIADLHEAEASALVQLLDAHFVDDDAQFIAPRPDAWFVRCTRAPDIATTPIDVVQGHGIYAFLPRGPEGRTWTRRQNEIQMLLHEHPVNVAREARGEPPVTGVWFWGGGTAAEARGFRSIAAHARIDRTGDLLRGIARVAHGSHEVVTDDRSVEQVIQRASASADDGPLVVIAPGAIDSEGAIRQFESRWLAPAIALLSKHAIARLDVIADGNRAAAHWSASASSWWRRFTPRLRPKPFVAPARPQT